MRATIHPKRMTILGLPVDRCSMPELRAFLARAFASRRAHRVVTLNPEIAAAAFRDQRYATTIRTADLVTVDGFGIALLLRMFGNGVVERVTGTTMIEEVCAFAAEHGHRVGFLLRSGGLTVPPLLRAQLKARWPTLEVAIGVVDPRRPIDPALVAALRDHAPAALIVGFGHPDQEEWIVRSLDRFPTVRLAVGVGGAVDYVSGAVPLPPLFVRTYGIEWAWRLVRQPWRFRRIVRAVIEFPLLALIPRRFYARSH